MSDDEKAGFWKGYDYAASIFYPQIAELKARLAEVREEHTPSELRFNGEHLGCTVCGSNDGYRWPCTTRLIVDSPTVGNGLGNSEGGRV